MAGREKKDYRKKVADVAEWVEKLEFTGLTVAEVYSDVFGPCDVMRPTIEKFMLEEEDADKVIQFLQANLTVLDKDVKERMEEEKKKEAERAMLAARQAAMSGSDKNKEAKKEEKSEGDGEEGETEEGDAKQDLDQQSDEKEASVDDKFLIPIIENYKKISPRPLFLFIKNKEVIDELRTASPPLMMLMIKNSMSGRKTTGEQSGLQRKIAEKRAKREAEEKEKEEEEKLAKLRDVPLEIIEKQNSETSEAIITAFTDHEGFKKLAKLTTAEIKKRDDDDNEKLEAGIKLAIDKGVLDKDKEDPKPIAINVLGRSPDEVTVEIIEKLGDAPQKGCIMTLEGLSGTGKGTTVAKLKEKLPNSSTWSNGDIFRSITLLAVKFAEEKKVDLEESLKPENLADFMKMLKFDKFGDQFDVEINGLGVKEMVSKVNKTLLKSKEVATNIPQVAAVTQGEVIMFVKDALAQMAASGMNVLVEGRAATLKYIDTPHRFELVMSDENIIGARRAAQRIGSAALAEAKELKDGKTWEILEKICKSMLPAEEADAPGAEQKDEGGKEDEKAKVEEAGKSGGGDNAGKEEEGEKVEVKKEEATPAKEEAKKEDSAKDKDAEKADPGKEEQGAKEEAKKEGAKEEAKKAEA